MEQYLDVDGDSGIAEYENGTDYIRVKFKDGSIYRYSYLKPGSVHVERMKSLAVTGDGLNSYINRNIGKNYEAKEA